MKLCAGCNTLKDEQEFNKNKTHKDGLQSYCKTCVKKQHQGWYKNNKRRVMQHTSSRRKRLREQFVEFKSHCVCCICSESEPVCLDFHHTNPSTKDFEISDAIALGVGWEKIQREIEKCVVVCKNCHAKIHAGIITLQD